MKFTKILFGAIAILCVAQAQAQTTPIDFQNIFNQFMELSKTTLMAQYEKVIAPMMANKDAVLNLLESISANFQPFIDIATTYSSVWAPFAETYTLVIDRVKSVIEKDGELAYDVIDLAYKFASDRAIANLTTAFEQYYNRSLVIYTVLYNGLTNPLTILKAANCIKVNWPKIVAVVTTLNTTVPSCFGTIKLDLTSANTYIKAANTTLIAKYKEIANCVKAINDTSSEADIQKAQLCVQNALNLIPYTASKVVVAILNAGIAIQDAVTVQELKTYKCLTPIINKAISQITALNATVTTCMK